MFAMGDCAINISYEDKLDEQGNVILSAAQQVAEVEVPKSSLHGRRRIGPQPVVN